MKVEFLNNLCRSWLTSQFGFVSSFCSSIFQDRATASGSAYPCPSPPFCPSIVSLPRGHVKTLATCMGIAPRSSR